MSRLATTLSVTTSTTRTTRRPNLTPVRARALLLLVVVRADFDDGPDDGCGGHGCVDQDTRRRRTKLTAKDSTHVAGSIAALTNPAGFTGQPNQSRPMNAVELTRSSQVWLH